MELSIQEEALLNLANNYNKAGFPIPVDLYAELISRGLEVYNY